MRRINFTEETNAPRGQQQKKEEKMAALSVMDLCKMTESELSEMTKEDLVASIKHNYQMPEYYRNKAKTLEKKMEENSTNERAACVMLAALVGVEMNRNECSGVIDSKQLNILELVGLAAAKMAAK